MVKPEIIGIDHVRKIRKEMDDAGTSKPARRAMARAALSLCLLTDEAKAEWEKEFQRG